MKKKNINGKSVTFGFANPEMHKTLRSHRCSVITDKKKEAKKKSCRTHNRDFAGNFFLEYPFQNGPD